MATKTSRNRAAEARAKGGRLLAIPLSAEGDIALATVQAGRSAEQGSCTQVQAVEWALREAAKKFRKKS